MKQERPQPAPVLSLQNKLDQIAHDRDVLSLQRALARHRLREGDRVRHADRGNLGLLRIARDEEPPRVTVVLDDGSREDFAASHWLRA